MPSIRLTEKAQKSIQLAQDLAVELGHDYIGTEHILYGLAKEGSGVASKVLSNQGITEEDIETKIIEMIGKEVITSNGALSFTPRAKRIIENSAKEAMRMGQNYVGKAVWCE